MLQPLQEGQPPQQSKVIVQQSALQRVIDQDAEYAYGAAQLKAVALTQAAGETERTRYKLSKSQAPSAELSEGKRSCPRNPAQ